MVSALLVKLGTDYSGKKAFSGPFGSWPFRCENEIKTKNSNRVVYFRNRLSLPSPPFFLPISTQMPPRGSIFLALPFFRPSLGDLLPSVFLSIETALGKHKLNFLLFEASAFQPFQVGNDSLDLKLYVGALVSIHFY